MGFLSCVVPGSSLRRNSKQGKANETSDAPWRAFKAAWTVPRPDCKCSFPWQKKCLKQQACTDYCNLKMELPEGPAGPDATHQAECFSGKAADSTPLQSKGCWCTKVCKDGYCYGKVWLTKMAAYIRDECKGKCASDEKCFINELYFNTAQGGKWQRDGGLSKYGAEEGMWCVNFDTDKATRVDWTWDGRGYRQ